MRWSALDIVMLILLVVVILAPFVPALMIGPVSAIYGWGVLGAVVVVLLLWVLLRQLMN